MRTATVGSAALLLVAMLVGPASRARGDLGYLTLPDGEVLRVSMPDGVPRGLVLLLPDALGGDTRSAPYVEHLLGAGFVAVEPQWQRVPPPAQQARGELLVAQMHETAERAGAPATAIGLVGFGFGARIALHAAMQQGWPAALLYPGCAGLVADPPAAETAEQGWRVALTPAPPRLLLLHGSADAVEPEGACATLAARLGPLATRHVYFGATYGWDYAPGPWENMASLLPAPDGLGGLRRANMSSGVTADAAARVADFLARHVAAPGWGAR